MPRLKPAPPKAPTGRRYATIAEAADYMRIGQRTVRLMIEDGRLHAYRFGPRIVRLNLDEVDAAMASGQAQQ